MGGVRCQGVRWRGSDVYRRFFPLPLTTLPPGGSQPVTASAHQLMGRACGEVNRESNLKTRKLQNRDSESAPYEPSQKYHQGVC